MATRGNFADPRCFRPAGCENNGFPDALSGTSSARAMGICHSCTEDAGSQWERDHPGQKSTSKSKGGKPKWVDDGHGNMVKADADGNPIASSKTAVSKLNKKAGGVYTTAQSSGLCLVYAALKTDRVMAGFPTGAATIMGYDSTKAWVEKKIGESLDDDLW